ncbi:MAG: cupredoxin domain-containing protein [Gammaproteobacteria bacterium]|nr:cupredoxin domain-containing protein [Gammaproteobacteria bacterium]
MTDIVVNILGLLLMVVIVWWFWMSKPKVKQAESDVVDILVDGGVYTPARIEVPVGKATTLRFLRKDASPCAEKVIFDDLSISADLAVDETNDVVVKPTQAGEYEFTCQMHMYRGSLIAR